MNNDKLKQCIAMFGGFIGALYLALNASGISAEWINPEKVDLWLNVLNAGLPFVLVAYGVYKNTYLVTTKAKEQEQTLKDLDMK
ncbi:phage holin [Mammaliicoccus sciuri]|uniref:phage holin n=1 Tax=Mammaliicoccus sciuri TaxID=1296 RepID=UPI000CD2D7DE|nr:phage holin [Mammaliicoccus sciuri]PNZ29964.1 PTS mannose transporter subunit IID [Mammaliicoccus sciuri]